MFEKITKDTFDSVFSILENSFPPTELRTKERQYALLHNPCYKLYGNRKEDAAGFAAVLATWEIEDILFLEHFAVREDCRNVGYGGKVLDMFFDLKNMPIILEAELPQSDLTKRRIGFYQRHGYCLNEYKYVQPPMREDGIFVPLAIMTKPREISETQFRHYRSLLYRIVYQFEGEVE